MPMLPFKLRLSEFDLIEIREVVPEDERLLREGFEHLSDQSRVFRFLAAHPRLSQREIVRFTARNDHDHFAIGALRPDRTKPKPIGIARYIRLHNDQHLAEFAVTIIDEYHGLGLGSLLLGVLAKHGVQSGISSFVALVLHDNKRMLNLLKEVGATSNAPEEQEIELRLPLSKSADDYPDTPVGDAFRRAYRLAQIA